MSSSAVWRLVYPLPLSFYRRVDNIGDFRAIMRDYFKREAYPPELRDQLIKEVGEAEPIKKSGDQVLLVLPSWEANVYQSGRFFAMGPERYEKQWADRP